MLPRRLVYRIITELFGDDAIEKYSRDYDMRLLVQKAVFMFQEISGIEGFDYSWYLAGPYAPELTSMMFNSIIPAESSIKNEWRNLKLTNTGREQISKLKEFFKADTRKLKQNKLTKPDWYELMASCHYIKTRKKIDKKEELVEALKKAKNRFSNEQINYVVNEYWSKMVGD